MRESTSINLNILEVNLIYYSHVFSEIGITEEGLEQLQE